MNDTQKLKQAQKILERQQAAVAKVRDKLDDDIGTLQELLEDCYTALSYLDDARDALSRLV